MDIHHHLAFGVDDGPKNSKRMFALLDSAVSDGITAIVATPHVTPGVYCFSWGKYRDALQEARRYIREKGYELKLYEGCEILYTNLASKMLVVGEVPTLARTDFVLVEFSPDVRYTFFLEAIEDLSSHGFRPIIAHCERYGCLTLFPSRVRWLKDNYRVYFQINCTTVIHPRGYWQRRFLKKMFKHQLVDIVATDAHNTSSRPVKMKKAWKVIKKKYGRDLADRLTNGSLLKKDLVI